MDTPILVPRSTPAQLPLSLAEEPWGVPNDRRGLSVIEPDPPVLPNERLASEFKRRFPLDTILTMKEFDLWAAAQGVYTIPSTTDPQSDACMALTQRRHQLRKRLNNAGIHPRMNPPDGPGTFFLDVRNNRRDGHSYIVRTPLEKLAINDGAVRIASFIMTNRRHLRYLFQSQDWKSNTITPEQKRAAQTLYSLTDFFEDNMKSIGSNYQRQYKLFAAQLMEAVESGELRSIDGGIRRLLEQGSGDVL